MESNPLLPTKGATCDQCGGPSKTERWYQSPADKEQGLCQTCGGGFQRGLVTSTHLNDIIKEMSKNGYGGGTVQEACVKCAPAYFGNKQECIMCPTRLPTGAPFEKQCSGHGECRFSGENPPAYLELTKKELEDIKEDRDDPVCTCRPGSGFEGLDCGECAPGFYYQGGVACVECEEFPERCKGGRNPADQCTPGYGGDKCLECSRYPAYNSTSPINGYYKMGQKCEPCPENDFVLILIICALVIVVLILLLFIYKIAQSKLPLAPMSSAIRHMQFMSFFIQINVPYPDFLLRMYSYLSSLFAFNLADMTSPECIVETSYQQEWIVYTSGPLALVSLIILWAAFGDPVIVSCKIWIQKRRGAFEKKAFGRSRSQVRKSIIHPKRKKSERMIDSDEDDDDEEEEGGENHVDTKRDSTGDEDEEEDDMKELRRSSLQVKKDFERDAERQELEASIAKSRQKEHTKKRLEKRRNKMKQEHDMKNGDKDTDNDNDNSDNDHSGKKKKLSRLEKRRLKKQKQREDAEGDGGKKQQMPKKVLSRQLSQSGRNIARISHEFQEDLDTMRDTMESERQRQKQNSTERRLSKKRSLKEVAHNIGIASTVGRRARRTRDGRRKRMSVAERAVAKAEDRKQLERQLSTNWGKLKGAAGTVVNKRKDEIKKRIRMREERMRIDTVDRVVEKAIKREEKKMRAKSLNRTMFMATVLLMLIYMTICQKSAEVWICVPAADGTSKVRGTNMVCNFEEPYMTPLRCSMDECTGSSTKDTPTCKEDTYILDDAPRNVRQCCPHERGDPSCGMNNTAGKDGLQCNPRTIRGVGLVNWTTPYTMPSGLNQSTVWNHVIGDNNCEGTDFENVSTCEVDVASQGGGSRCLQRQRMRGILLLLFQWVEYTNQDDNGLMAERVQYKLQNIGVYPPNGVEQIRCGEGTRYPDDTIYDGCFNGRKVQTGSPLTYYLLLSLSIPFFVLYGLGTPIMYMVILGKASLKRNLHENTLRTRYGWIYTKFNERCWWFFLVDMIRKLLTVCVAVLANGTVLTKDLVRYVGWIDKRPCMKTDPDPSLGFDRDNGYYCGHTEQIYNTRKDEKDEQEGTAILQASANIIFITINMALVVLIRPYRCLECKLESMAIMNNKTKGNDVKLAMLSFEDALDAKDKEKRASNAAHHHGRRSSTAAGAGTAAGTAAGGRWKKAGTKVAMTNILTRSSTTKKWWERDEYVSWHVRKRRQCGRSFLSCMRCTCFYGCRETCCGKKRELDGWEKCWHMSNTDQMEGGLLSIQLMMVGFGLSMLLVRRLRQPGEPDESAFDSPMDIRKFTIYDGLTSILILALFVPLWWSVRITMKAMKAYKMENKDTKKTIKGNTCCGKWMRRIGNG